jgi:hypothetical protein
MEYFKSLFRNPIKMFQNVKDNLNLNTFGLARRYFL